MAETAPKRPPSSWADCWITASWDLCLSLTPNKPTLCVVHPLSLSPPSLSAVSPSPFSPRSSTDIRCPCWDSPVWIRPSANHLSAFNSEFHIAAMSKHFIMEDFIIMYMLNCFNLDRKILHFVLIWPKIVAAAFDFGTRGRQKLTGK